jgi:hypothetical protein
VKASGKQSHLLSRWLECNISIYILSDRLVDNATILHKIWKLYIAPWYVLCMAKIEDGEERYSKPFSYGFYSYNSTAPYVYAYLSIRKGYVPEIIMDEVMCIFLHFLHR